MNLNYSFTFVDMYQIVVSLFDIDNFIDKKENDRLGEIAKELLIRFWKIYFREYINDRESNQTNSLTVFNSTFGFDVVVIVVADFATIFGSVVEEE